MHLVQVDDVGGRAEEALACRRERDGAVAEFPVALGGRADGAAEEAGEELVAEADARELEVGLPGPEF